MNTISSNLLQCEKAVTNALFSEHFKAGEEEKKTLSALILLLYVLLKSDTC